MSSTQQSPDKQDRMEWSRHKVTQQFHKFLKHYHQQTLSKLEVCSPNELGRLQGNAEILKALSSDGAFFNQFLQEKPNEYE